MGSNDNQRGLFDYQMSKQPLKNVVSMLIKDKDIKSYQFVVNKTRSCACKLKYLLNSLTSESGIFFYFSKKNGSVGRWETKHFIWMA